MNSSPFCPRCGKQFADDARFCSSCGAQAVAPAALDPVKPRLVRPRSPRMVAGVCSGVAIFYGWDVTVVRILFAVFFCLSLGVVASLLYLAGWVLIPDALYALPAETQRQGNAV